MHNFEKEAQQRSVTKAVGRALNPMEWIRQLSSREYRELIAAVDRVDKVMRNRIAYLKPSLRDNLHQARMAMKNREFRKVFQYSNAIIDSVSGVFIEQTDELTQISNRVAEEFSRDKMEDWEKNILEQELGVRKASINDLVVEAGVTQWLKEQIPTRKEIEGTLFDKIFRNMQGKQQEAARQALSIAERAYLLIKEAFDALDNERRNIVEYVKLARKYQNKLTAEKEQLKRMYTKYFLTEEPKPPINTGEQQNLQSSQAPAPVPQAPVPVPPVAPVPEVPYTPNLPPGEEHFFDEQVVRTDPDQQVIASLFIQVQKAIKNKDNGIASSLLVKASEMYDNVGDEEKSIKLLRAAMVLQGI
jgi:hypothetical protein